MPAETVTQGVLRGLARTPEERAQVELIISESHRTAEASARIERQQVAELGQGRCPASLLAPFTRGRRR